MAERLTKRTKEGYPYLANVKDDEQEVDCKSKNTAQRIMDSWERLAAYEDLGTVEELAELVKAKQDGRCMVLPCKVRDTVYTNLTWSGDYERIKDKPYRHKVVFVGINGEKDFFHTINEKTERMFCFDYQDIGKTVFLTREEAEAALKEQTNGTP